MYTVTRPLVLSRHDYIMINGTLTMNLPRKIKLVFGQVLHWLVLWQEENNSVIRVGAFVG